MGKVKTIEDEGLKLHLLHRRIIELKQRGMATFLELAICLKTVRDNKLYEKMSYETFEAYIASPELGFDRGTIYRLIEIYEKFCKELNVAPGRLMKIYWTKLREILPIVNKNNYESWLLKAETLSRSDLIEEIKDIKRLPTPKLPKDKYQVIYADPPWEYDADLSRGATRNPINNYPVMNLAAIQEFGIKVKDISYKDCILFLWITAPKLNWLNEILESWGFEYKTNLIWDKIKPNMGHYSSVRHEILIIAGKGTCAPTCDGKTIQSIDSVQSIEKSAKHSEKPIEFYKIIEKLYPKHKKIELFARNKRDGWTSWGDELNV